MRAKTVKANKGKGTSQKEKDSSVRNTKENHGPKPDGEM